MKLKIDVLCEALNEKFIFAQNNNEFYVYEDKEGFWRIVFGDDSPERLLDVLNDGRAIFLHYVNLELDDTLFYKSADGNEYRSLDDEDPDYDESKDFGVYDDVCYGFLVNKEKSGEFGVFPASFGCGFGGACVETDDVPEQISEDMMNYLKSFTV